jgi:metallo-beta-lactamase family protein
VIRRAEVVSLDGFSAHADQKEILDWVTHLEPAPRRIFLVHGEPAPLEALSARLKESIHADVHIPRPGEKFDLWG